MTLLLRHKRFRRRTQRYQVDLRTSMTRHAGGGAGRCASLAGHPRARPICRNKPILHVENWWACRLGRRFQRDKAAEQQEHCICSICSRQERADKVIWSRIARSAARTGSSGADRKQGSVACNIEAGQCVGNHLWPGDLSPEWRGVSFPQPHEGSAEAPDARPSFKWRHPGPGPSSRPCIRPRSLKRILMHPPLRRALDRNRPSRAAAC